MIDTIYLAAQSLETIQKIIDSNNAHFYRWGINTSTFIAVLALFISLYQLIINRRQQNISMIPNLNFRNKYDKSGDYIGVYLENSGPGPAKHIRVEIEYDGKKLTNSDEIINILKFPTNRSFNIS